jgi:hypothetical protein
MENKLDDYGAFERIKMSRDSFGSLKSYRNFINPFGFVAQLLLILV